MLDPRSDHQAGMTSPWAEAAERGSYTTPLSSDERRDAEHVARRLLGELRSLLMILPEHERGASSMSRLLDLDRATCQRIVATAAANEPTVATLVQLPGVLGLRQFTDALRRRSGERAVAKPADEQLVLEQITAADAAIERFEDLLSRIAGSQRRLKARLAADSSLLDPHEGTVAPADDVAMRESLFRAAAAIVGRWSSTTIDVRIVRPIPDQPDKTEGARMRGQIGHVSRHGAVPFEVGETASLRALNDQGPSIATLDDGPVSGASPNSLFLPYCSLPLPKVFSRAAGARVVHVLDTEGADGHPNDIVMAFRSGPDVHPAKQNPAVGEMWWLTTFPARRLVFDVWLHRDLASRCIPSLELHLWGPDVSKHGASRWSTRFPGGPKLESLGKGLGKIETAAYPRHGEMTADLYKQIGWDPNDFVGFRCEVAYPVWRAGYCMGFDFGAAMPAAEA